MPRCGREKVRPRRRWHPTVPPPHSGQGQLSAAKFVAAGAETTAKKRPFASCGKLILILKSARAGALGDSEGSEPDVDLDSNVKAMLRFTSFAFPSVVTILTLLRCWRKHFSASSLWLAVFIAAFSVYFTVYCHRRSRGLSASFGYNNPGPDREWSYNDQSDIAALWAAPAHVVCGHWGLNVITQPPWPLP
jgi:hypothetical protein